MLPYIEKWPRRLSLDSILSCYIVTVQAYIACGLLPNHEQPGGRLNKKDGLTRYGNFHVKDKTS